MNKDDECPCGSGKSFGDCCQKIISGEVKAPTAEALMRARYSSYVSGDILFLRDSSTAPVKAEFDERSSRAWSRAARWHGLEILSTEGGGENDDTGVVEFRATYTANGEFCNHHEISNFVREPDGWKFDDGHLVGEKPLVRETPKVGRNDPCPCGSGKKFKKCCGKGQA